jgi:SAM-dependent methyltransferase
MSKSARPPCCLKCGSLERHRMQREILQLLPRALFSGRSCLQFSHDAALDPTWFFAFEISVFGGMNSLDVQSIERPDASYDYVTMNHVLEFVPDERKAFAELIRILTPDGILQIGFSDLIGRKETIHSDGKSGPFQHRHLFGRDLVSHFRTQSLGVSILAVTAEDPITDTSETVHFFCRHSTTCNAIRHTLKAWREGLVLLDGSDLP